MGDPKGFMKIKRKTCEYRPVDERVKDYKEVTAPVCKNLSVEQSSRCMDCGTPFCNWSCPIGNYIPEWNDLMCKGKHKLAYELLAQTNNFPEFTGKLCPALCEHSCVLGINDDPVTIREDELCIIENAFNNGWVKTEVSKKTDKKVAIIGSGPAGLATADQLNKAGHKVTVFEKDEKVGGILRYGIPNFKLDKELIDRRVKVMEDSGVEFKTESDVSKDITSNFDAVCLATGSRVPRDIAIEGRDLKGIHFAMDYLMQATRKMVDGKDFSDEVNIDAKDKNVVVIGGGDTGSDCVGTANRQGAKSVTQIEIMPRPGEDRASGNPWPEYAKVLKTSSSHKEGAEREWEVLSKKFIGEDGIIKKIACVQVKWEKVDGRFNMKDVEGSEFELDADLVVIAAGFLHPEQELPKELGIELNKRGNIKTDESNMCSKTGIFSAGDCRRGQSLIVWAISEGRRTAHFIDKYLMGESKLPLI